MPRKKKQPAKKKTSEKIKHWKTYFKSKSPWGSVIIFDDHDGNEHRFKSEEEALAWAHENK